MVDKEMVDIVQSFEATLKKFGQERLKAYREKVQKSSETLLEKRSRITKEYEGFQLQLITVSGGTISIFVALQGGSDVDLLTKLGFAGLGLSLLFGVVSLFFGINSKERQIEFEEESLLSQYETDLDLIEKFGHTDVSTEKEMYKLHKDTVTELKKEFKEREEKINSILKVLQLSGQNIADLQLILFLAGILLVVVGLFVG